ncbi:MAG: hypothetical protein IIA02_10825 [Proteobacteria bacterium]|nr:hypothetical protein [Pseudomonadota bacterium]
MSRSNPSLLSNVAAAQAVGSTSWQTTGGYLHSVDASLEAGSTSATVDIYVSNSSSGRGVKIASLALTVATPADGFSLPKEDQGWFFVRGEVSAVVGKVKGANACVGE